MHHVMAELQMMAGGGAGARQEAAATLVDLMRIVSSNPLAQMVFDPKLPPVRLEQDLDSDLIVITTAGLTLPPQEAFAHPEVLRQQPLEALIGRAVLYLIAALARQTAFADPSRFCAIVADELWWLTGSAEGTALISEILHDGRKHNGGLFMRRPGREGTRPGPRPVRLPRAVPHPGSQDRPPWPGVHRTRQR